MRIEHTRLTGRGRAHRWRAATTIAVAGATVGALTGCGPTGADEAPPGGSSIVATTTVLGDVTAQVAQCAGLEVRTLMPVGADPHDFAPSSADISDLVRADLVVANGLGLEEGLAAALESARADGARIMEVAPLLDPIPMADTHERTDDPPDEHPNEGDEHELGSLDPHVWLDAGRMAQAARLIAAELAAVTGDADLLACGNEVGEALDEIDTQVRETLAAVPSARRVLVSDHAAFGYFADAYDFAVPGVVVPGGSTLADPSTAGLAALVDVIRDSGVHAVFANTAHPTDVVAALADEVGEVQVIELYVGSLGPEGSGAETYGGMMTTNARLVADALSE